MVGSPFHVAATSPMSGPAITTPSPTPSVRKPLTLLASARVRILDRSSSPATAAATTPDRAVEDPAHLEGLLAATRQVNTHTTRDRLRTAVPATATLFERLPSRARRTAAPERHQAARTPRRLRPQELGRRRRRRPPTRRPRRRLHHPHPRNTPAAARTQTAPPPHAARPTRTAKPVRLMTWRPRCPRPTQIPTTLATDIRRLGLNRTADDLNDIIATATRKRWGTTALLEHIAAAELEPDSAEASSAVTCTGTRTLQAPRRLGLALADHPRPPRPRTHSHPRLGAARHPVQPRASQDHVAKNIAHQAILAGQLRPPPPTSCSTSSGQDTARALARRRLAAHGPQPGRDRRGRLPRRAGDLIFQLVSRRYVGGDATAGDGRHRVRPVRVGGGEPGT